MRRLGFALSLVLFPIYVLAQAPSSARGVPGGQPPVDVVRVEPHSHTRCALAAVGTDDPDPWGSCLLVAYKNVSSQSITAIRFDVTFISALKEAVPSEYSYEDARTVRPGKTLVVLWHDGVYWHQYGDKMEASVAVAKVMFADGTFWTAPEKKPPVLMSSIEAFAAGLELQYPNVHVSVEGAEALVSADNADETMCRIFHMQRVALRMMGLERVKVRNTHGEVCYFVL